ncbi:MAG: hypothetical protein E7262_11405 [Lachnospiraceae bacterium]|nr:hypothetical protein [Lachnospiraceae bacterium]
MSDKMILVDAVGVMLDCMPQEELNIKLKRGKCEIKFDSARLMEIIDTDAYNVIAAEIDRYVVEVPDKIITININMDRRVLEHYIDGYETISINEGDIDLGNNRNEISVTGEAREIKRLRDALGRNCIKTNKM